jgi:hypothetical protein
VNETVYHMTMFMMVCLDFLKQAEQRLQAQPAALIAPAVGALASCQTRARPLDTTVDRAGGTATYRIRRASRRDPVRRLRLSCQKVRNGTTTLRIRTRSRRTKLRSVLGPRLVVGLHRSARASGTANVRTAFKRG